MGQTLYGPHDGRMITFLIALLCLVPAVYYRQLWKVSEQQKENLAKNMETMEWWRE